MEDNKNLEGQGQQNQEPNATTDEKEPTVEELMAQLAQERANSAKLQNDYNQNFISYFIFVRISYQIIPYRTETAHT